MVQERTGINRRFEGGEEGGGGDDAADYADDRSRRRSSSHNSCFLLHSGNCYHNFIMASITDWLDGYLARKMNCSSTFGAFLDPVADKLMVAAVLVLLCTEPAPTIAFLPWASPPGPSLSPPSP
ncbi:hypothetical protein CLOM_g1097 [Closterium sp. NIES-68]|nr:hypothetical protein CLOM_g1097 [Closterium sp. NIES-68]